MNPQTPPNPEYPGAPGHQVPARRRGKAPWIAGGVAALVVLGVVLVVLFTVGPFSSANRDEDAASDAVKGLGESSSFADFNDRLCSEFRMPQSMVDTISRSGAQTGTDIDTMFRDQAMSQFPKDLDVTGVEIDGDTAVVSTHSSTDGQDKDEQVHMRREDGDWKVCEPGVGMGSVPQGQGG